MDIITDRAYSFSQLGQRDNQEDARFPDTDTAAAGQRYFVVCDGVGGSDKGEDASRLVATTIGRQMQKLDLTQEFTDDRLIDVLDHAFIALDEAADKRHADMGTTLTMVVFHAAGCTMAHIGDSRIYHIRPNERRILYKSRDHSLVYDLFMAGEIKQEEMDAYPRKNVITRAIMPGLERQPKADIVHTTDILSGDFFILCSDGILEQMSDRALVALLASGMTDAEIRQRLIEVTKDNKDNHSAWLVRVDRVEPEAGDESLLHDEDKARSNALLWEKQPTVTEKEPSFWEKVKSLFN